MNLDPTFIDLLCCPETKQRLRLLTAEELATLMERQHATALRRRSGAVVQGNIEAALLRQDEKVLYTVEGGIPHLLIEAGIALDPPLSQPEGLS